MVRELYHRLRHLACHIWKTKNSSKTYIKKVIFNCRPSTRISSSLYWHGLGCYVEKRKKKNFYFWYKIAQITWWTLRLSKKIKMIILSITIPHLNFIIPLAHGFPMCFKSKIYCVCWGGKYTWRGGMTSFIRLMIYVALKHIWRFQDILGRPYNTRTPIAQLLKQLRKKKGERKPEEDSRLDSFSSMTLGVSWLHGGHQMKGDPKAPL